MAIKIPEEEYKAGLEGCKNNLHGHLFFPKGNASIKFDELKMKLAALWKPLGPWRMVSLGKGYYEFSFSSLVDRSSVWLIGTWNLKPGLLRLSSWTADFNPTFERQTHVQCWVRIQGLPQEYWRVKIIFAIAGGIGTPVALDEATSKKTFGHFARFLVDLDLNSCLQDQILVEREGFTFFVSLVYEKLPSFYPSCQVIGYDTSNCRSKAKMDIGQAKGPADKEAPRLAKKKYIPKAGPSKTMAARDDHFDVQNETVAGHSSQGTLVEIYEERVLVQEGPRDEAMRHPIRNDNNPLLGFIQTALEQFDTAVGPCGADLAKELAEVAGTGSGPSKQTNSEHTMVSNSPFQDPWKSPATQAAGCASDRVRGSGLSTPVNPMTVDHNLGESLSEDIPPITNANIAKDMRIVGKFWSDALDNEQETDHDSNSTTGVADGNSSPQEESKDGDQVDSAGFKQVLSKS